MAQGSSNTFRADFAQRLRDYRIIAGFRTARALAQALGIDENRYTRYERAEVEPDLALLARMSAAIGVTPNELLGFPIISGPGAGFSEDRAPGEVSDTAPAGSRAAGRADIGAGGETNATSPLDGSPALGIRALAWHIACQLTPGQAGESEAEVDAGEELRRTADVFRQIEADPFAFVTRVPDSGLLNPLSAERRTAVVANMNELLSSLGGGGRR